MTALQVGLVAAAGAVLLPGPASRPPAAPRPQLRSVAPADLPALRSFMAGLSRPTRVQRFFAPLQSLPSVLEQAIVASDPRQRFVLAQAASGAVVALGQAAIDADAGRCELAFVVADDWQRRGVGRRLMAWLLSEAELAGLHEATIETLRDNVAMQTLALRHGFRLLPYPGDPTLVLGRRLLTDRTRPGAAPAGH